MPHIHIGKGQGAASPCSGPKGLQCKCCVCDLPAVVAAYLRQSLLWLVALTAPAVACVGPAVPAGPASQATADAAAEVAPLAGSDAELQAEILDTTTAEVPTQACQGASECPASLPLCLAGKCSPKTPCTSDKQCLALDLVCDKVGGACVACNADSDCADGLSCKANACLPPAKPCKSSKECASGLVCDPQLTACVECVAAGDCSPGQICQQSVCKAAACTVGDSKCVDAKTAQSCNADGSGWDSKPCASDQVCVGQGCIAMLCSAGVASCDGNTAVVCNATGTATTVVLDCATKGQVCLAGACVTGACEPGPPLCADSKTVAKCNANGSGYDKTPCASDQGCLAGQCQPKICMPGEDSCNGSKVLHCNASGTAQVATSDCATTGLVCVGGSCAAAPKVCTAGTNQCNGTKWLVCKADGSGWETKVCDDGNPCSADGCETAKGCTAAPLADKTKCGTGLACVAGVCVATKCGNGVVDNGEQCDDGNSAGGDGCSDACAWESFASCAALKAKFPKLSNGLYPIDPDGEGPVAPIALWCDLTGGWTLVANVYDGPGNDVPDATSFASSGWLQTGNGAWTTSGIQVDRGTTLSASAPLATVAALGKFAAQHGMKMCFVNQVGDDVLCRSTADGTLELVSQPSGNGKLAPFLGELLPYTFGRIVGMPGSVDSYDYTKYTNIADFAIPRQSGMTGEWGSGPLGLVEKYDPKCPSWNGIWHGNGCGISYRPYLTSDDELGTGIGCCSNTPMGNNPTPNTYGFRLYVGGHLCGNGVKEPGEQCDQSPGCDSQCWAVGDNKWRRYAGGFGQDVNNYIPGPYDWPVAYVDTVPDALVLLGLSGPAVAPNTMYVLRTWVYVDTATSVAVAINKDDCGSVWLNGKKLGGGVFSKAVQVTLALPPGWSTVEYVLYNGPGGGHFVSDIALASKVKRLSSVPPF